MTHTGVTSVGSERQAFRKRLSSGVRGNRRLARLGWSGGGWGGDQDRIPLELHSVGNDRERRGTPQDLARLEREHALVPGAGDGAAHGIDGPLRETRACVSTAVRDGVHRPRTLKSATASPPTYTRRLVPAGRSASAATGVYPSARVGRREAACAAPAPPNVTSMSHRDICTHVKVGVSRSVYEDAWLSRSSITRSRKSAGLSPSNATMNSWSSSP